MATKIPAPEQLRRYHEVSLSYDGAIEKESVSLTFATTWRGDPVLVEMTARRYAAGPRGDLHLTDWQTYAERAVLRGEPTETVAIVAGPAVSDTARARLSEACKPAVAEYLTSSAYVDSHRRAVLGSILRELGGSQFRYQPTATARRWLAAQAGTLGTCAGLAELVAAADALDNAAAAYAAALAATKGA